MAEKTRVLIFTTAYRPLIGGSEIAIEEIVKRLPNIYFDILTPKHRSGLKNSEQFENGIIYRIGPGTLMDKFLFPILGFIKALKFCPKIIHGYQASFGSGAAFIYKTFFPKTKFILTLQEGKNLEYQNYLTKYFRGLMIKKADIITAISSYLVEYAKKINSRAEIVLIPNGVDLNKFKPGNNHHSKTVITVSRLVKKNGVGDLIEAMVVVGNEIPDAKLTIIGDGPLRESLTFKVKSLKLENNVKFLGEISNESIPEYLSMADVFVRPSLSEGLGTSFLEAMAAELPIIATPVGGIPDFLKDGETGLFCRIADSKDLAEKIVRILKDEQLREKIITNAKALVAEKYDWNIIARKFEEIYAGQNHGHN